MSSVRGFRCGLCNFHSVLGVECVPSVGGFGCGSCDFYVVLGVECVITMLFWVWNV